MTKTPTNNDADFVKQLELVAFGCHKRTEDDVRKILNDNQIMTYQYLEFFLDYPIVKTTTNECNPETAYQDKKVYLPFIKRLIQNSNFLPTYNPTDKTVSLIAKSNDEISKRLECSRQSLQVNDQLPVAPEIIKQWLKGTSDHLEMHYCNKDAISALYEVSYSGEGKDLYHLSFEMNVSQYILSDISTANPLYAIIHPISSKNVFYGYIIIHFQVKQIDDRDIKSRFEDIRKEICNALEKIVGDFFFPTILLFHVTQYEKQLKAGVKDTIKVTLRNSAYKSFFKELEKLEQHRDSLEKAFGERFKTAQLGGFYLFKKYNVISPTMMRLIRQIAESGLAMKKPDHDNGDNLLPSALIYGEAGSGKDILAKLIPQFTKDYPTDPIEVINMAALKPNALAIPILTGYEIGVSGKGLLIADTPASVASGNRPKKVLIFDELNSLDYDLQGALLRVLENGEVQPLFGKKAQVEHLIIGIINEDPKSISREKEVELLNESETLLGKILNTYIKEGIIHSRRLRPDLMYRLMRGVFLKLPSLNDRREDIPILFSTYCRKSLELILDNKNIDVDFDLSAMELLMDDKFNWIGNVRQLQKVAKDAAVTLNTNGDEAGKYKLTENVVIDALNKTFG